MQLNSLNPVSFTSRYLPSNGENLSHSSFISDSISSIQSVGQNVLSEFTDYLFYASWSNPNLGRLVSGTLCTMMGTSCMVKSKITQRLYHWLNQSHCTENEKKSRKDTVLFSVGTLMTIYGVYNVVTGLFELFSNDGNLEENQSLATIHAGTAASIHPTKCEPHEEIVSAKEVLTDIINCPNSVAVLEQIRQRGEGKVNIKDLVGQEETYYDFHGMWLSEKRTVYVKDSLCHRNKLTTILYEFLNANRTKEYDKIAAKALVGEKNREEYTRELEEIGYANRLSHHKIIEACVQTQNWDPRIDVYGLMVERYTSFKSFWKVAKDSPHSNLYREQWNKLYKNGYCKKHGHATECQEKTNPHYQLSSHLTLKDEL